MPVSDTTTEAWMAKEMYAPGRRREKAKPYKPYRPLGRVNMRTISRKNPIPKKHLPSLREAYHMNKRRTQR